MNEPFKIVIPARFQSSRLPGKPLLDICGKVMIQRVFDCAIESGAESVVVATDDVRISKVVEEFGGEVVLTSSNHRSGTDRLAEVANAEGWDDDVIVVNLQGDEPLMDPQLLFQVADNVQRNENVDMATLATPISARKDIFDPNVVKVVCNQSGLALYFTRAPVPWVREDYKDDTNRGLPAGIQPLRHLGIYAYRVGALKKMSALPPCALEQAESLEQLRALWYGMKIHVGTIDKAPGHGVDTAEDLERVRQVMTAMHRREQEKS